MEHHERNDNDERDERDERISAHFKQAAGTAGPDDLLLARLRQEGARLHRRRRLQLLSAVAATAAAVVGIVGVVRMDDSGRDRLRVVPPVDRTTARSPITLAPTTTTSNTVLPETLDWDHVRYDIGIVKDFTTGEGGWGCTSTG
jgi:hypothetical protein